MKTTFEAKYVTRRAFVKVDFYWYKMTNGIYTQNNVTKQVSGTKFGRR